MEILVVLIFLAMLFGGFTGMLAIQLVLVLQRMKIKILSLMPGKKNLVGFSQEKES